MYAQNKNTVRAYRNRPLLMNRDISGNDMAGFYSQLLDYFKVQHAAKPSIGDTAVKFYLLNHGVALLDGAAGPDATLSSGQAELYRLYHDHVGKIGVRMVYDIVFMLTALASTTHPDSFCLDAVESSYGPQARAFIERVVGNTKNVSFWTPDFSVFLPVLKAVRDNAQGVKLGDGIRALGYVLDICQRELSYGPLWRDVARVASSFFEGHKSLETTIDTAFTFCHCNGSFFEKGKLFTAVGNDLFDALDVQRSGQIPQFVHENKNALTRHKDIRSLHATFARQFPEVFLAPVAWSDVKKVTRNQLVFTSKYQKHWNATMGGGAAAAHNHPTLPKIFSPIDEEGYINLSKTSF